MSTTVSNCIHNSLVETFQDDHPRSKVTITLREQNETKYPASFLSAIAFLRVLLLLSEPKKDTADISANSERIKIWDFFQAWNKCIVSFFPMRLIEFESHKGKEKQRFYWRKWFSFLFALLRLSPRSSRWSFPISIRKKVTWKDTCRCTCWCIGTAQGPSDVQ